MSQLRNRGTPFLTMLLAVGLAIGAPIAIAILFTKWEDSVQRQIVGILGIFGLGSLLFVRRKYEVLILLLVFLSQFEVSLYSVPLNPPAQLQFYLSDVFLLLLVIAAIERGEKFRLDNFGWIFVALISWQAISTLFFSAHFARSFIFVLWQIKYLVIYGLMRNFLVTDNVAQKLKTAVFMIIGVQALLAIAQQVTGGTLGLHVFGEQDPSRLFFTRGDLRVSGTLGATNGFGGYMAMMLVMALPFIFRKGGLLWRGIYAMGLLALLLTFSRAGWLSFFVGVFMVALVMGRAGVIRFTRLMGVALVGAAIISIGIATYYQSVQARFDDRAAVTSAMGRITQFAAMWPVIEKHYVGGIGPGVTQYFGAWNQDARYLRQELPDIWMSNQPHNSLLQVWIEAGTPAFMMFFMLFLMAMKMALSRPAHGAETQQILHLCIGASAAAATAMIDALFGTEFNSHQIAIPLWFFLGLARNRNYGRQARKVQVTTRELLPDMQSDKRHRSPAEIHTGE